MTTPCLRCKKPDKGPLCGRCHLKCLVAMTLGIRVEELQQREAWPLSRRRLKTANELLTQERKA